LVCRFDPSVCRRVVLRVLTPAVLPPGGPTGSPPVGSCPVRAFWLATVGVPRVGPTPACYLAVLLFAVSTFCPDLSPHDGAPSHPLSIAAPSAPPSRDQPSRSPAPAAEPCASTPPSLPVERSRPRETPAAPRAVISTGSTCPRLPCEVCPAPETRCPSVAGPSTPRAGTGRPRPSCIDLLIQNQSRVSTPDARPRSSGAHLPPHTRSLKGSHARPDPIRPTL
jgi:hypothetical protein